MLSKRLGEWVEIFCGIGGFAEAIGERAEVHGAVDINRNALDVYRLNFPHPVICKTIESLSPDETEDWADKSWWLSPPCQPYTRRGHQLDLDDSRSLAFLRVVELVRSHQPPTIAMENVPAFARSRGHSHLTGLLNQLGYNVREITLCPTQFGYSNRRNRFYLVATKNRLKVWQPITRFAREPAELESAPDLRELVVADSVAEKFKKSFDVVRLDQITNSACFTSAYGRSHIHSGSYLLTKGGLRRFSPREILWQLGFGRDYVLPDWPYTKLWPLVGNTLSIPVVRYVMSHLQVDCKENVTSSQIGWR